MEKVNIVCTNTKKLRKCVFFSDLVTIETSIYKCLKHCGELKRILPVYSGCLSQSHTTDPMSKRLVVQDLDTCARLQTSIRYAYKSMPKLI